MYAVLKGKAVFVFDTTDIEKELDNLGREDASVFEIDTINIQHEILFELSKNFKSMLEEQAQLLGIKEQLDNL